MSKIKVYDVLPGSILVECGDEIILAGIPPEVVKAIILKKLPLPTALLIPDKLVHGTNLQNCTEFPLYHFLFVKKGLEEQKKLKILGHKQHVVNNEELLRLTLLGPKKTELQNIGIDEDLTEMFIKEAQYFQFKDANNESLPITHFIENFSFDQEGSIKIGNVTVSRIAYNRFDIAVGEEKVTIDLNTEEQQHPPYPVQIDCTPNELCKFGIEILGGATGFSASSASSGLVIVYNGTYIIVDSIPYLDHHLVARGVSKSQVSAIFLSHIHDDHCNLLPLMLAINKIKIISTKEIYWMAIYKLALMLNRPVSDVMKYFDLVPLTVGKTLDFYGLKIRPHYTVHTIPTIGAKFFVQHKNDTCSMSITSDNQSLKDIDSMEKEGIISQNRADRIRSIYKEEVDILFADGGEGLIHGGPEDAINSKAHRVVFFHLDTLPSKFNATFSIASAGKRYVIVQGDADYYSTRATEFLIHHFYGMENVWISILRGNMEITRYNTDDVIIKQGATSKNKIYIIITGYCIIVTHDGEKSTQIAHKEAGDLFGEMAIVTGAKVRSASVIAHSPVTLCEMSEEIFYALILKEKFKDKLIDRWNKRGILERLNFFSQFPSYVLERLSSHAHYQELPANQNIKEQNGESLFYIIISGSVEELTPEGGKRILKEGDFFGDFGAVKALSYKYTTIENCTLFSFSKSVIQRLLTKTPLLLYTIKEKIYNIAK